MDIAALLAGLPSRGQGTNAAATPADRGPDADFPRMLQAIAALRGGAGIDAEALREVLARHAPQVGTGLQEVSGHAPRPESPDPESADDPLLGVVPEVEAPATALAIDAAASGNGDRSAAPPASRPGVAVDGNDVRLPRPAAPAATRAGSDGQPAPPAGDEFPAHRPTPGVGSDVGDGQRRAPEPALIPAARDSGGQGLAAAQGNAAPAAGSAYATAASTAANGPQAPVASPAWGRELGQQLAGMAMRGGQQVELRLNPPELGPLSVSLRVDDQGVQAQFLSAHAAVRSAVEQAVPQLRDALAEQGIALDEASVGEDRSRDPRERTPGDAGDDAAADTAAETASIEAGPVAVGHDPDPPIGGVDLYA